jgi:hypothetical protein
MSCKVINILAVAALGLLLQGCNPTANKPDEDKPEDPFALVPGGENVKQIEVVGCDKVARVIGVTPAGETLPNPNSSFKRFGVASTDFGNMWDAGNGSVFCIFGDNFNDRGGDWLSNAIAVTTDKQLEDGLFYDSMLWDPNTNRRKLIIPREGYEITCIPTGGFSVNTVVGTRQYVNYMAIKQWAVNGDNDSWSVYHSELVYSDDFGRTWIRSGVKWDGDSKFAQIAYVVNDGFVYMWGTPSGRHGNVSVARVKPDDVLLKGKYEYWDGSDWVKNESMAAPVASGHVSEMTVRYNSYYKRYIMMYLDAQNRKMVFRDSASPQGEWSGGQAVHEGTYGPSIHPWFCDGRDLWFVSSSVTNKNGLDTWHIFLYHSKLRADENGFNMVWEGGFENDPDQSLKYHTSWSCPEGAYSSHDAHSGTTACKLNNGERNVWKDACKQTVALHKNTNYKVSGWAKCNIQDYNGAYLGVRLPDGSIFDFNPKLSTSEWTLIEKQFNSGNNTIAEVFCGTWGDTGLSVIFDDISLVREK